MAYSWQNMIAYARPTRPVRAAVPRICCVFGRCARRRDDALPSLGGAGLGRPSRPARLLESTRHLERDRRAPRRLPAGCATANAHPMPCYDLHSHSTYSDGTAHAVGVGCARGRAGRRRPGAHRSRRRRRASRGAERGPRRGHHARVRLRALRHLARHHGARDRTRDRSGQCGTRRRPRIDSERTRDACRVGWRKGSPPPASPVRSKARCGT